KPRNFAITGLQKPAPTRQSVIGRRRGATGSSPRRSETMALPAIGARAPERPPLTLPDVRRIHRMPSLPEWVASRVASMKDEHQPAASGEKHRMVPTLPANLILNPGERAEIERHADDLDALCRQTPEEADEYEASTLIVVTKLMLALPS